MIRPTVLSKEQTPDRTLTPFIACVQNVLNVCSESIGNMEVWGNRCCSGLKSHREEYGIPRGPIFDEMRKLNILYPPYLTLATVNTQITFIRPKLLTVCLTKITNNKVLQNHWAWTAAQRRLGNNVPWHLMCCRFPIVLILHAHIMAAPKLHV